jgi:hypothetical protein
MIEVIRRIRNRQSTKRFIAKMIGLFALALFSAAMLVSCACQQRGPYCPPSFDVAAK